MRSFLALCGTAIVALSPIPAQAEVLYGLTLGNAIVTFDSAAPTSILSTASISGIAAGDVLTGIDFRPANQTIYSLATSGNLYTLTAGGGGYTAALVGTTTMPNGSSFGIDFNPVADRLRLVSDTNQNLRINPANGVTIVDGAITLNGSSNVDLVAAAYTNSVPAAASTSLYAIDSITDALVLSTNPNAGTYTSVGALGVGLTNLNFVGFDISGATGSAYLNIDSALYGVNLTTGSASFLGTIGAGTLRGISAAPVAAAVPEPATWAMSILGFGLLGGAMRKRKVGVRFA